MRPPKYNLGLSVFFPCYNEAENVEPLARKTVAVLEPLVSDWELILVNDGSRDKTGEVIDRLGAENPRIRPVHHAKNGGYGAALRTGFRTACKEYVFFTDGDGQFDVREIETLLARRDEADILCGYRQHRRDQWIRKVNAACWSWLVKRMLRFRCRDVDGAFKLFRRDIFDRVEMKSTGAMISAEILARAHHAGFTMIDIPVTHLPRTAGHPTGANLRVILRAFKELVKLRKDIVKDKT